MKNTQAALFCDYEAEVLQTLTQCYPYIQLATEKNQKEVFDYISLAVEQTMQFKIVQDPRLLAPKDRSKAVFTRGLAGVFCLLHAGMSFEEAAQKMDVTEKVLLSSINLNFVPDVGKAEPRPEAAEKVKKCWDTLSIALTLVEKQEKIRVPAPLQPQAPLPKPIMQPKPQPKPEIKEPTEEALAKHTVKPAVAAARDSFRTAFDKEVIEKAYTQILNEGAIKDLAHKRGIHLAPNFNKTGASEAAHIAAELEVSHREVWKKLKDGAAEKRRLAETAAVTATAELIHRRVARTRQEIAILDKLERR